jgi:hypothetical protein
VLEDNHKYAQSPKQFFYILLTVHPDEIVGLNQLDAPCSLFQVFILLPLHVSSDKRSSSGGNKLYQHTLWYNTLAR